MLKQSTLKQALLVGISTMCLASTCEKNEVPLNIPTVIPITQDVTSSSGTITRNQVYNIDSLSSQFAQYKNNIGDVTIHHVYYTVLSTTGADNQVLNLKARISDPADTSQIKTLGTISNFNVKQNVNVKKEFVLDEATKTYLVTLLKKAPPKYRIVFSGTSSTTPTNFKLKVEFDVTFKPKV